MINRQKIELIKQELKELSAQVIMPVKMHVLFMFEGDSRADTFKRYKSSYRDNYSPLANGESWDDLESEWMTGNKEADYVRFLVYRVVPAKRDVIITRGK